MNNQLQSSPPTFAALDLGSNSFHLMIARCQGGKLEVLDRHREMVRLASGLGKDGALSDQAIERALDTLRRFAERLRSTPNARVRVVGTNTLRAATNSDDFLTQAEAILGCPIDIISGIEEARLIYLGAANDFAPQAGKRLVVDIGGGSTELILGEAAPSRMESLYMGCVSYSQRFFPDGAISAKAYRKATLAAREELEGVAAAFSAGNWAEAVGTSGTIRAIETILEGMELSRDHHITPEGLSQLAEVVCRSKNVDKLDLPNLGTERAAVLPGGLAVLEAIFQELAIEQMQVSNYAVREGIILDLAGMLDDRDVRSDTVALMMEQYRVDSRQARRVRQLANRLLEQVSGDFGDAYRHVRQLLGWAIDLHEIGLSIAHSGYHKHGAYILQHSEMAGFSKQEQKMLGFLVLNHRRKLRPMKQTYGFDPDWRLVQIMRLACLFNRRRDSHGWPEEIRLDFKKYEARLALANDWLEAHPLTAESLRIEQQYQKARGNRLTLVAV